MNCSTFSFPQKNAGFTLIEVMMASGIAGLVFAAICFTAVFTTRSFLALGNYADLDQASRNALDIMSRDIRQTKGLTAFQTNQLTFQDFDGAALTYTWNSAAGTLSRQKGAETKILLAQCDYLSFGVSQRNPSNDFNFYAATNLATVKLIDVSWNCSRQILQQKVNTESVQTAKIVIRN